MFSVLFSKYWTRCWIALRIEFDKQVFMIHQFFDQLIPFYFRNASHHLNPFHYSNHLNHGLIVDFSRSHPYFVPREREFHSQAGWWDWPEIARRKIIHSLNLGCAPDNFDWMGLAEWKEDVKGRKDVFQN